MADNGIYTLPSDLSGWKGLQKLHLYGNNLTTLPLGRFRSHPNLGRHDTLGISTADGRKPLSDGSEVTRLPSEVAGLLDLPSIQQIWLEGNPLGRETVEALLRALASGAAPPSLKAVGLDERQLEGVDESLIEAAAAAKPNLLRTGEVRGSGPGYFKLQKAGARGRGGGGGRSGAGGGRGGEGAAGDRLLVVAFGSAPGLPNWGGVLRRVEAAMEAEGNGR